MNTYFFVRVRLGRAQGRRSFSFGPYVQYEDAFSILDSIPDLLVGMSADPNRYSVAVEERHLDNSKWIKVNTRLRLKVSEDLVITEAG